LQAEVKSLEIRLNHSRKEKKELEQQLADVERENNILKDGTVLNRRLEQIRELERENQQLRQQPQTAGASLAPDYEAIRDRTLNKLKLGKQSTAGKAIEAFIKELKHGL
jgi:chromosome segregation ATPase